MDSMKKYCLLLASILFATGINAQVEVTRFLGIPIDGTKQQMIQQIQSKGFTYDSKHDCLDGQFNGADVHVFVATNGNKVWRVMVSETTTFSEGEIRIRFNNLLGQFQRNKKYIPLNDKNFRISNDEAISYEMAVKDKRYSAEFLQITSEIDTAFVYSYIIEQMKATSEQMGLSFSLDSLEESDKQDLLLPMFNLACLYAFEKNKVWFMINQFYGKYYISIYYDNEYNKADGEDL